MKYRALRLTRVEDVLFYKDAIVNQLLEVSSMFTLETKPDFWFKTICRAVTSKRDAYVAVVLGDDEEVYACGLAQDVTPVFYDQRIMAVITVYFKKGHKRAVFVLQNAFERWCKANRVKSYFFLTTRQSGAAMTCFGEFGLRKKSAVFMKGVR